MSIELHPRIHPEFPRNPNERGTDLEDRTRARNQDNIAILIMKENFDLTPQVNKICLPTSANRLKTKRNEYWLFSKSFQTLGPRSEKTSKTRVDHKDFLRFLDSN